MPAHIGFALESIAPATWSNPYEVAFGLHRALLPAIRDVTGFDELHGKRLSLVVERLDSHQATGRIGLPVDTWVDPVAEALAVLRARQTGLRTSGTTVALTAFGVQESHAIEAVASAPPTRTVEVMFDTVTVFSAGDRGHRSVADPRLIVRSWAQAWRAAAVDRDVPDECPAEVLERLGSGLAPIAGALRWETAALRGDGRRRVLATTARPEVPSTAPKKRVPPRLTGFTGSLTLQMPRDAPSEERQWLSRLATLAPYAGTGMKPQNGLGATRASFKSADPSRASKRPPSADAP